MTTTLATLADLVACPCGFWHHPPVCQIVDRITAAAPVSVARLTLTAAGAEPVTVTAATSTGRSLGGTVVRYGVYGLTSKGRLKVAPGALIFPEDLGVVKLTREHDRDVVRGYLTEVDDDAVRLRVRAAVSDGPEGDDAIREAHPDNRIREGLSFDVVDAVIDGDTITSARVIAIGQVGIPAYDDGRIDQVAAALTLEGNTPMLTEEQRRRLAELAAMTSRNTEEEAEFVALIGLVTGDLGTTEEDASATASTNPAASSSAPSAAPAPAPQAVAASYRPVPSGAPAPRAAATTAPAGGALTAFVRTLTDALRTRAASGDASGITAALADVTHSAHTANVAAPAWSGELWSGLLYETEWSDLFVQDTLTHWSGNGWRFTKRIEIEDYAGNKTAVPSNVPTTEPAGYEAARMAVGIDVDRKFYDFPDEGFVLGMVEQVRESWAMKLDAKVRAYALTNAVPALSNERDPLSAAVAAQPTLLRAAAVAVRALKRRKVGSADFVYVNDDDLFSLLDYDEKSVPAFLDLWGIDPRRFRSSEDVPAGTVLAGKRQAASVRVLPGSPIRVEAQNIANGGVDNGWFGYWAIEEHHTSGIARATFTAAP